MIAKLWCTPAMKALRQEKSGSLKYREDIVDGLENAPEAFIGMLQGKNFCKLLARVS
jgi:NADPH-dependent curcumin reductase CurA